MRKTGKQRKAKYQWIFSDFRAQRQVHVIFRQEGNSAFRLSAWLLPPLNYEITAMPSDRLG